jgi:hypothetical protein
MVRTNEWSVEQLSRLVLKCLGEGKPVEIDGLGVFLPDAGSGFRFEPSLRPKVFVAYVVEDQTPAGKLYDELSAAGFDPWMDQRKLLPGQNWPRAIENAIETSDFFVPCFSSRSVSKKGGFQAEIRYALDCARTVPLDEIFIVPIRLDACPIPRSIEREIQYIDLFPDWGRGVRRVANLMHRQFSRRTAERPGSGPATSDSGR